MSIVERDIPPELIGKYLDHKCGFFVGAGLSKAAGFPDWKGLLNGLIKKAEDGHSITPTQAEDCRKLANDQSKFLMLAEEMKEVLDVEFKTYLEETFGNAEIDPRQNHNLLVTLNNNNFIITTNYDLLIEKALVNNKLLRPTYKYYEADSIQRELYLRGFFLLKAHGDAKTAAGKIILTDKDYRKLLYSQPAYQSVLQSIFTMYSVIFIGCSLQDPELKLLLNYINAAFPEGGIPHYALMPRSETSEVERKRWKKDYNVRVITISSKNDYEDIDTFLKILHLKEHEQEAVRK